MKKIKKIDVYGQLILIAAWPIAAILPYTREQAFIGYFIVGGWQLASTIIHNAQKEKLLLINERRYYERALIGVFVGLLSLPIPFLNMIYLYLLLFLSPLMAVWYLSITIRECRIWHAKALVHLK